MSARLANVMPEKHLGVAGAARNWNTVNKVAEIAFNEAAFERASPPMNQLARFLIVSTLAAGHIGAGLPPARAEFLSNVEHAISVDGKVDIHRVNIIDGADDRDSLLVLGPQLGLSPDEIERIRKVSGYVGCFLPTPSVGTGALYLSNRQVLTAGHIFFEPTGEPRTGCFFRNQDSESIKIDILLDDGNASFGGAPPGFGSNDDYAIVRLAEPILGGEPFPIEERVPVAEGDALIVVTAHPVGMARDVDNSVPVVQPCTVRRAPISSSATSFYRTDCDATGSSSGGMHLARVDGRLVFRGITITTGPWRDEAFRGAPYDEQAGSVTTALGTNAAILAAGSRLAAEDH